MNITLESLLEITYNMFNRVARKKGTTVEGVKDYFASCVGKAFEVPDEVLISAGLKRFSPLREQEQNGAQAPAAPAAPETKGKMVLTFADGTSRNVPLKEVLNAIAPYASKFPSPMDALRGAPGAKVLKLLQKFYGREAVKWEVVTEAHHQVLGAYMTHLVGAMIKDPGKSITEIIETFTKKETKYLQGLFPHSDPVYLKHLIKEAKTALDHLGPKMIPLLFPHVNKVYLTHIQSKK